MFNVHKEFFNVGKEQLHTFVEEIALFNYKEFTICNCKNCPFSNNSDKNALRYCNEYCTRRNEIQRIAIPKFKNIKHYKLAKSNKQVYKLPYDNYLASFRLYRLIMKKTRIRLSSSQIKQMIAYYYLANSKGYVDSIKKKYLSKLIGCSVRTVENNNKLLEELNFILTGRHEKGSFSVVINNYNKQYKKDGLGYAVLSKTLFKEILNTDNVNCLRILIQAILKNDMNTVFKRETAFNMHELKQLLPSHLNYIGAVEKAVSKLTNSVKAVVLHNNLVFNFSKDCNAKALRQEKSIEYKNYFVNYIEEFKLKISKLPDHLKALTNLSFEYGFDNIKQCFSNISDEELKNIKNLGGYIREKIRSDNLILG